MPPKGKKRDPDEPRPLNFDYDERSTDPLKPSLTPEDERGDNEDDQYYEEEEAISPEEVSLREEEGDLP